MANNIDLNIRTKYQGEGFKKLNNAVKDASKNAANVTGQVQKIGGAIDALGGQAGKVAGNIKNLFSGFAQGGVIGLAIAGVTSAFSFLKDKIDSARQKAKEMAEEMKKNLVEAVDRAIDRFNDFKDKIQGQRDQKKAGYEVDALVDDTKAQAEIVENSRRHGFARKMMSKDYDIQHDKTIEGIENEQTKQNRALSASKDKLMIARGDVETKRQIVSEAQIALESIRAQVRDQLQLNADKRAEAERKANKSNATKKDKDRLEKINTWENQLNDKIKKAEEAVATAMDDQATAELKVKEQEQKYEQQRLTYADSMRRLQEKRAEAEKALADATKKAQDEEKKKLDDENKKRDAEAKKKKEELEKIREQGAKEAEDEIERLNKAAIKLKEDELKAEAKRIKETAQKQNQILEDALTQARQQAQAWQTASDATKGKDFNQWQREQKQQAKDAQKAEDKEQKDFDRAQKERSQLASRIFGRNGGIRRSASKQDIKRFRELSQFLDLKGGDNKAQNQVDQLEREKVTLQRAMNTKLGQIADKLNDITL